MNTNSKMLADRMVANNTKSISCKFVEHSSTCIMSRPFASLPSMPHFLSFFHFSFLSFFFSHFTSFIDTLYIIDRFGNCIGNILIRLSEWDLKKKGEKKAKQLFGNTRAYSFRRLNKLSRFVFFFFRCLFFIRHFHTNIRPVIIRHAFVLARFLNVLHFFPFYMCRLGRFSPILSIVSLLADFRSTPRCHTKSGPFGAPKRSIYWKPKRVKSILSEY